MQAILIYELKGFSKLSSDLALKMDEIGLTPERIRASTIDILKKAIDALRPAFKLNQDFYIGGDTFVFTFNTSEEATEFGCELNHRILNLVTEKGLYYLKPCACIGFGNLKLQDDRFLDDTSISTYRIADSGLPFILSLNGIKVIEDVEKAGKFKLEIDKEREIAKVYWKNYKSEKQIIQQSEISIPSLLLDSEIIFSSTAEEAVKKIRQYQAEATRISAFGGPIPYESAFYNIYLKETIDIIKQNPKCKWTTISYLDINDKKSSYYWLELARRISLKFSDRFTFTAYVVPDGVLIPYSYQIYDDKIIHLGLRSYVPERNVATMNASIIFKNQKVALRYKDEFIESYRKLGTFTDERFAELVKSFSDLDKKTKKDCIDLVDDLLK